MRAANSARLLGALAAMMAFAWLGLSAARNGVLAGLFVLHGAPANVPAAALPPTRADVPAQAPPAPTPVRQVVLDGSLVIPVAGVRPEQLVDTFSAARANGGRRHDAIDIVAPVGTPIFAAAPGRVEKLFLSRNGGNTIYVRSRDRLTMHYYAHLDSYAEGLHEGQEVAGGQLLGRVGFSGNANPAAPHLHFAIWQVPAEAPWYAEGQPINPYPLLREGRALSF